MIVKSLREVEQKVREGYLVAAITRNPSGEKEYTLIRPGESTTQAESPATVTVATDTPQPDALSIAATKGMINEEPGALLLSSAEPKPARGRRKR
jgi:hypothetical protein